jgi:hypothetical protein
VLETFMLIANGKLHHAQFSEAPVVMLSVANYDALQDALPQPPEGETK